ncbi:transcription-repair coupling factor [Dorcoceras hygrometricum]|uniref:Transcription-repair coupling factor n=1 Tax=Dorcoceras hygrometricum TaxID=472368 RepID=A0A2Z7CFE9_9LAMI|nr:transcription-repair coupling factor [Dorcoceras hygrometricum]
MHLFVYGSTELNLLRLSFFQTGRMPLKDFHYYSSCNNPIPTAKKPDPNSPQVVRTPSTPRYPLAHIAFSARLSEEATRVSQHFGVFTIGFSSCAFVEELVARAVDRYDDVSMAHSLLLVVSCVLLVAADQQARLYESVEKRRRLN